MESTEPQQPETPDTPDTTETPDTDTSTEEDDSDDADPATSTAPTAESVQLQLQNYKKALEEELREKEADNAENAIGNVLEYFQKHMNEAAAQIVFLASNSTSDSTRLAANKYMIEVVRRGYAESPTDPVAAILKGLMTVPDPVAAPGANTAGAKDMAVIDAIKRENTNL